MPSEGKGHRFESCRARHFASAAIKDDDSRAQAAVFAIICLAFLVGAAAGALARRLWGNLAMLIPVGCLLTLLAFVHFKRT